MDRNQLLLLGALVIIAGCCIWKIRHFKNTYDKKQSEWKRGGKKHAD